MQVKHLVAATCVALISLASALPAAANTTVLTIDLARAQVETELGQDIQRQLTELLDNMTASLQTADDQLQADYQELNQQHDDFIITDEVFEQRMLEIQQRGQQLAVGLDRINQISQIAGTRAEIAFRQAIAEDVEAVYEERNGDLLLSRSSVFIGSDDIDITVEVIERVNNRITELEVQLLPQRPEGEEQ